MNKSNLLALKVSGTNDCNDEAPTTAYLVPDEYFFATMQKYVDIFKAIECNELYSMEFFYFGFELVNVIDKSGIPNLDTHNLFCIDESLAELQDALEEGGEYVDDIDYVRVLGQYAVITKHGIKFVAHDKYSGEEFSTTAVTLEEIRFAMDDTKRLLVGDVEV